MQNSAVENALREIAKVRAVRDMQMARRAEMQQRAAAIMNRPPAYVLKKYGGQQLSLGLDGDDRQNGSARH